MDKHVKAFLSTIGKKGGSVMSDKKLKAILANATKARQARLDKLKAAKATGDKMTPTDP